MFREILMLIVLVVLAIGSIYGTGISASLHLLRRIANPQEVIERDAMARKLGGAEKQW